MAQISIPGGGGTALTFSVTGNAAINYAHDFSAAVASAPSIVSLSSGDKTSTLPGALNIITPSSAQAFSLAFGDQYTFASVSGATQLTGSAAGGDTVLAGGGVTYAADGGSNRVIFFAGDNVFNGGATSGNTVTAGAGSDTINAGTGATTVFGGSGTALIDLADVAPAGDVAVLNDGQATVDAFGAADTVFASGADVINGGAHLLVFVATSDPTTGAAPAALTVVGGTGGADLFGINGTNLTFQNSAGAGLSVFVAGAGNETLDAAGAAGAVAFFADRNASDSANVHEVVTGGTGADFFMTGTGAESITGGSGVNLFGIDSVAGGQVTIAGFNAQDYVQISGLSAASGASLIASDSTVSGGNLTITLGNGTTVEFLGVSSLTGHIV